MSQGRAELLVGTASPTPSFGHCAQHGAHPGQHKACRERSCGEGLGIGQTPVTPGLGLHRPEPPCSHLRVWVAAQDRAADLEGPWCPAWRWSCKSRTKWEGVVSSGRAARWAPGAGLSAPACGHRRRTLAPLQLDLRRTSDRCLAVGRSPFPPHSLGAGWAFQEGTSGVLVVRTPHPQIARVRPHVGGRRRAGLLGALLGDIWVGSAA